MSIALHSSRPTRPHRRRAALALALTATTATALAGCSATAGDSGGQVEISYAFWDQVQADTMQTIIDEFETENPDIKVTTQVTPWDQYWTKLQTSVTGGSAPDVFWMNLRYFPSYAANGVLLSLDDIVDSGEVDPDDYIEAITNGYTWDGTLYGVPKDIDSMGLWYNKTLFDEAGLDYPDDTWTWTDLQEAAATLTNPETGVFGIAAQIDAQQSFYNTIPQAGGFVISEDRTTSGYDTPEALEGLQFWIDFIEKGHSPSLAQMSDTVPDDMFSSGKVAMLYQGSWAAKRFAEVDYAVENVDVAMQPQGVHRASVSNGLANVVWEGTSHPEAAQRFAAFLGSERAAEIQASTGAVIPATKGAAGAWVEAYPQFSVQTLVDQLEYAVPFPASIETATWAAVEQEEFRKAYEGRQSAQEALTRTAEAMNEVLASERDQ